jgi:site-specific DNA recombinase
MSPRARKPVRRVAAYLRVSTERQAERGQSLEVQREAIRRYAELYDLEIAAWITDPGASAKSLRRPGLDRLRGMLRSGEVEGVVVSRLDRLTRSVRDLGRLLEELSKHEASLLSVGEQIDTRSAAGRMILNVLTSIAQWERETIGERVAAVHAHKRSKMERVGKPPYGFRVADDGRHLERDPREQDAIRLIVDLRGEVASFECITGALNDERDQYPPRGDRWHPTTVQRIVRRYEAEHGPIAEVERGAEA